MPPTLKIFEVQNRNNIFRHTGDVVQLVVSNGFQSLDRYHRSCRTPKNRAKTLTTKDKRSLVYLQRKCHNFSCFAAFRFSEESASGLPPSPGKFRRPSRDGDGDGRSRHAHSMALPASRALRRSGNTAPWINHEHELLLRPRSFTKNRALLV